MCISNSSEVWARHKAYTLQTMQAIHLSLVLQFCLYFLLLLRLPLLFLLLISSFFSSFCEKSSQIMYKMQSYAAVLYTVLVPYICFMKSFFTWCERLLYRNIERGDNIFQVRTKYSTICQYNLQLLYIIYGWPTIVSGNERVMKHTHTSSPRLLFCPTRVENLFLQIVTISNIQLQKKSWLFKDFFLSKGNF